MKMFFSFLLLFFIYANASSQVTTSVKAGVAISNVEVKGNDNMQIRITGYGGLSFNIPVIDKIFFQPEALYSIRGYSFRPNSVSERHKVYFSYITAPLLFGYKISKNFSVVAGPELGYMVRARYHSDDWMTNLYDGITRKFNVDVDAGVAVQVMKGLNVEARVNFGVTALYRGVLFDQSGTAFAEVKDGYHRVIQVGVSLAL